jgi:hypothetical protein
MEIKIQLKSCVLSICIGYKTKWFDQISFLTIIKEYYRGMEVYWAVLIFRS